MEGLDPNHTQLGDHAKRWTGVTTQLFARLASAATAQGIAISAPYGQVTAHHCTFRWDYNPVAQELVIEVLSKPALFWSWDKVLAELGDLVDRAIAAPAAAS